MASIFEYRDYKAYLRDFVAEQGPSRKGLKTEMARAMGCQLAYLSQVLHKSADLSLEQGIRLAPTLGLGEAERDFFLLVMQRSRAGTAELGRHFDRQIKQALETRLNLKERLKGRSVLSAEDQAEYYRHWATSVIHMMLTVPAFRTKQAIAERLRLPLDQVTTSLDFLLSVGLAVEEQGVLRTGETQIHLGKDSPLSSRHHANWRLRAIEARGRQSPEDISYSSVLTMSREDAGRMQRMIADFIEESRRLIHASPEEEVFAFCIDYFVV